MSYCLPWNHLLTLANNKEVFLRWDNVRALFCEFLAWNLYLLTLDIIVKLIHEIHKKYLSSNVLLVHSTFDMKNQGWEAIQKSFG